jgi:hypothetical protein
MAKNLPQPIHAALTVAEQLSWEAGAGLLDPPPGASPVTATLAEPPLDGPDTSWPSVVRDALGVLQLGSVQAAAARLHAFDVVEGLDGEGAWAGRWAAVRPC